MNEVDKSRIAELTGMLNTVHASLASVEKAIKGTYTVDANVRSELMNAAVAARNAKSAIADIVGAVPETQNVRTGDGMEQRHDSFGLVSVSRVSGHSRLFGSDLPRHAHVMRIRVSRAGVSYADNDNRPRVSDVGVVDRHIVEFDLSAAQFAEMITTMNVADGTPCTLRYIRGRKVDDVPDFHEETVDRVAEAFKERLRNAPKANREAFARFQVAVAESGLSKPKQQALLVAAQGMYDTRVQEADYVLERVTEAVEARKSTAAAEIDAMITGTIHKFGLEKLAEYKALSSGDSDE